MAQGVLSLGGWVRASDLSVKIVLYYERENCIRVNLRFSASVHLTAVYFMCCERIGGPKKL